MSIFEIELQGTRPSLNAEELLWGISKIQKEQSASYNSRLVKETLLFNCMDLIPALAELLQFGKRLRQVGHLMQVEGSAAASVIMHAMGFCSLNPIEFELHLERFIDPGNASPGELDLIARVSMNGADLCCLLNEMGYTVVALDPAKCVGEMTGQQQEFKASRPASDCEAPTICLQVITSAELSRFNKIQPGHATECLSDEKTWDLLGRGETADIPRLESEQMQRLLRTSRPRTIEVLARLMGSEGRTEPREFQEELMTHLHEQAGIPLRTAWELIRTFTKGNPGQIEIMEKKIMDDCLANGTNPDTLTQLLVDIRVRSHQARCKSHYLAVAYLAFQSAFVRVHGAKIEVGQCGG